MALPTRGESGGFQWFIGKRFHSPSGHGSLHKTPGVAHQKQRGSSSREAGLNQRCTGAAIDSLELAKKTPGYLLPLLRS